MSLEAVMQTVVVVRSAADAVRSLLSLRRSRKRIDDVIPVYRLATRDELLRARSDLAIDVTSGLVPR
ncbi:hypothetical protein GCM10011611_02500 [Aliidongia dinghuensis]|uniref:Uncharacterized protein n=1 Tax=Aliidongia dinghuensis TaxID=1867774 RepID=A0A8J2YP21_9PROT|nr:hypothetical protein [Aliidongia dinghuensis]GGF00390.1 hypothetical protein GCM10011611_02500 [Aliidongia dinghuensis]